jgi:hypothetical protein
MVESPRELRSAVGAAAAGLAARSTGKHAPQPEIPPWRGRDRHRQSRLARLVGSPGPGSLPRVAVCEAAIDALSLTAIEQCRPDTLYAVTAGGMGPATVAALQQLVVSLAADPLGILIAATDADIAGRRYAARLKGLAVEARVRFSAILPPDELNDRNEFSRVRTRIS